MNNRKYIIVESIREIAFNNKEIFIVTYDIKENINDKNEVIKVLPRLWEVLLEAYNNDVKGVRNANKLLKSSNKVKVGYYQGNIVAVAFYSDYKNGNKLMYGGAVRGKLHNIGKQCFQAIAYRDTENIEEYNWVEASGSVEKTFKMHNAYMLPNKYVEQILGKNVNLCEDGFHYQRVIGNDNEVFTKIIFGINSEDLLNKIAYETFGHLYKDAKHNYEMLRATQQLKENKQVDVVTSNDRPAFIQYAINIYDCFNETSSYGEIYEMPSDLLYYLKYANEILKNYDGEDKTVINYSELCEDLLSVIQPLEIICKKAIEVINKEEKLCNNPFTNKKYEVGKSFKIIQHPQHYYNKPFKCRKWHIDVEIPNELGYLMYHPTTNTWDFYEEFVISEWSSSCCCKYKTIRAIKKALLKWKLPVGAIVTCTGRYIEDTYKFKIL